MDTTNRGMAREMARLKEKVELLAAERGDATRSQSAIRRGELMPLGSIGLKSEQVTATPTMNQHNALQADVKAIFDALALISNRLGNARRV